MKRGFYFMNHNFDIYDFINFLDDFSLNEIIHLLFVPACIIIVSLIIGIKVNSLITNKLKRHIDNSDEEASLKQIILTSLSGLPRTWCIITGIYWSIHSLKMTSPIKDLMSYIISAILIMTIFQVLARAASGFVDFYTEKNENMPKTTLLNNIIVIIIYAIGIMITLETCGVSVTPILTAMGVGGMALALALQDTLSNAIAGLQIILTKQLHIGDFIQLNNGRSGQISDITWRYTTINTSLGNAVVVPNKEISNSTLVNYNIPEPDLSILLPMGVSYDSDLDHVEKVTLEVAHEVCHRLDPDMEKEPLVLFTSFGDSSINFNVLLHCSSFTKQKFITHEFIKEITARYRKEGIDIPFPIRTVYNKQ